MEAIPSRADPEHIDLPDCVACKTRPTHRHLPCRHDVCYEHLIGKGQLPADVILKCPNCGEAVQETVVLSQMDNSATVPTSQPSEKASSTVFTGIDWSKFPDQATMEKFNRRGSQGLPLSHSAPSFTPMTPLPEAEFGGNAGLNPFHDFTWSCDDEHFSDGFDPGVCTESDFSNDTFASQPAPQNIFNPGRLSSRIEHQSGAGNLWAKTTPALTGGNQSTRASQTKPENYLTNDLLDMRIGDPFAAPPKSAEAFGKFENVSKSASKAHPGSNVGTKESYNLSAPSFFRKESGSAAATNRISPAAAANAGYATLKTSQAPETGGKKEYDSQGKHPGLGTDPKELVRMIMAGETEDPFDTRDYFPNPPRQQQPVFGPVRFTRKIHTAANQGAAMVGGAGEAALVSSPDPSRSIFDLVPLPEWLAAAEQGKYKPTLTEAFDVLPIAELYRMTYPSTGGVVRVSNIPYNASRAEMVAFVGRNAQILLQPEGTPYHAVHIILERETGKTMDCFIELKTLNEAAWVVRQFEGRVASGREPKVGDRIVEVHYSSQDELMYQLFPRAKNVTWSGGQPNVSDHREEYYPGKFSAGFQGFMHSEEFVMMLKHAEQSERAPFAARSPTRVYESLISILHKYPWYAVKHVTLGERTSIWKLTFSLMKTLAFDLRRRSNRKGPLETTPALLQEVAVAALTCVGFSERQKACLVDVLNQGAFDYMADGRAVTIPLSGKHEFSAIWPFNVLCKVPGADMRMVKYFATLFREATVNEAALSLHERQIARMAGVQHKAMGDIKLDLGPDPMSLSLADIGKIEMSTVEAILNRLLGGAARAGGLIGFKSQ